MTKILNEIPQWSKSFHEIECSEKFSFKIHWYFTLESSELTCVRLSKAVFQVNQDVAFSPHKNTFGKVCAYCAILDNENILEIFIIPGTIGFMLTPFKKERRWRTFLLTCKKSSKKSYYTSSTAQQAAMNIPSLKRMLAKDRQAATDTSTKQQSKEYQCIRDWGPKLSILNCSQWISL